MNYRTKRLLVVAGLVIAPLLAILVLALPSRHAGETPINLIVVPGDSKAWLDGQPSTSGRIYLRPGSHTLKASRQYFTDVTLVLNTKNLEPNQDIYLTPGADTPEAIDWLNQHPEVQQQREAAGSAKAAALGQSLAKKYPIIGSLPYLTLDYKIGYALDDKNQASFIVTLNPVATTPGSSQYKQQLTDFKAAALQYLKSQGIDQSTSYVSFTPDPDKL